MDNDALHPIFNSVVHDLGIHPSTMADSQADLDAIFARHSVPAPAVPRAPRPGQRTTTKRKRSKR